MPAPRSNRLADMLTFHNTIDYLFFIILLQDVLPWDNAPLRSQPRLNSAQTKSPVRDFRIGLQGMGTVFHDFFSIPMLLSSSELVFAMSQFAPNKAANRSKQIVTAITNIGPLLSLYAN